jgi:1-acyl-sn-glycerol-3-phosphate acyltransferase
MTTTNYSLSQKSISYIRFTIGFSYMAIISVIYIVLALCLLPSRVARIKLGNIYGSIVGPVVIRIVGSKAVVHHRERITKNRPAIYLSNHTTGLDPLIAIWLCPTGGCGVAKKEITRIPFFGWAYKLSGHLLIDRSNRERAIASMKKIGDLVKENNLSIWIWPEGTRSRSGRMLPLKKGFVHLALQTKIPIVPIVVHEGYKRWHSHKVLLTPGVLEIEVLPPVDTSDWKAETMDDHIQHIQNLYNAALSPQQQLLTEGEEKSPALDEKPEN